MSVNVKYTVILRHFYSKWSLLFVSVLFVLVLVSFGFISMFSGVSPFVLGAQDKKVSNETELRNAISNASDSQLSLLTKISNLQQHLSFLLTMTLP
jgi:hypothetical protein